MKKIYLFGALLLCVFVVNAQVFRLSYVDRESGDSLVFDNVCHILLDSEEDFNATFIYFENISGQDISYRVQLTNKDLAQGATVQMCFSGSCLETDLSDVQTLQAGEVMRHFDLSYIYPTMDVSRLRVNFVAADNDEVLQSFDVTYSETLEQVSVPKVEKNVGLSLSASPIPASSYTNIRYSIPAQYKNANIVVRNPLGTIVAKYGVPTGKNGKVNVNVSNLNSGMYFYSIVADGKTLSTKKLIVKH